MKPESLLKSAMLAAALCSPLALAQAGSPTAAPTADATKAQATDANGDGMLGKDEVTPGTSVAKRFDALDVNRDGVLSQQEYVAPSTKREELSGRKNPSMGPATSGSSDVHGNRASN